MARKTLSDKLAELANPTPQFVDPEDEFNEETRARLDYYDDEQEQIIPQGNKAVKHKTNLRQKNAEILAFSDPKYAGQRVSRRDLEKDSEEDDSGDSEDVSSDAGSENGNLSSDVDEKNISNFLSSIKAKFASDKTSLQPASSRKTKAETKINSEEEFEDDEVEEGDDEEYEEEGDEEFEDDEEGTEGEEEGTENEGSDGEDEEEDDEEMEMNSDEKAESLKSSASKDVGKGKALQNQISLWDHLLECRIKLHKFLHLSNQLPQGSMAFKTFVKAGDAKFSTAVKEAQVSVKTLLDSLLELQGLVLKSNPQTKGFLKGNTTDTNEESDEEIPSDTEDEVQSEEDDSGPPAKKKLKLAEYSKEIGSRHERYRDFCNRTLQFWNEKTRLTSGRTGKKSGGFGAFEQSILKQIEIILADKQRLINRTRIKRSTYRVLGTESKSAQEDQTEATPKDDFTEDKEPSRRKEEDEFDPEIYDDDDFYHQLLRELIERKTAGEGGSDQVSIGRQWLEIQKLRSKAKRKVDTKASKGRRLRFHVHPKLVSLMAPHPETSWNDAAKNELFASLFATG